MTMRAGAVDDALVTANVPVEQARAAAEEIVAQDTRLNALATDTAVLKWMMGTMIVLQVATLGTILSYAINHMRP